MITSTEYFLFSYDLYPVDVALMPLSSIYSFRHLNATRGTSWKGHCIHTALYFIEAVPIVGMIVSLFERYIAMKCRPDLFPQATSFNLKAKLTKLKPCLYAMICRLMSLFKRSILAKEKQDSLTLCLFNEKLPQDIINEILIKKIGNPQLSVICKKWRQTYQEHFYLPLLNSFEAINSEDLQKIYEKAGINSLKKEDHPRQFIAALIQDQEQRLRDFFRTKAKPDARVLSVNLNSILIQHPQSINNLERFKKIEKWLETIESIWGSKATQVKLVLDCQYEDGRNPEEMADILFHKRLYQKLQVFPFGYSMPRRWFGLKEASPFLTS